MLYVQTPSIFAYYFGAFGHNAQRFGYLSHKTTFAESTIMLFTCFTRAAEYGVTILFSLSCLQALIDDGRLCANEKALVPLSCKIMATILK